MNGFTHTLIGISILFALALPVRAVALSEETDETPASGARAAVVTKSAKTADELARELVNPLAALTSFNYRGEYRQYQGSIAGADDATSWAHIFQPVIPFKQKNGKGWVFRFTLPYIADQPIFYSDREHAEWLIRQVDPTATGEGAWTTAHGHTDAVSFDLVYGGVSDSGFILQYGVAGVLPTSSDTSNARQQFILGPEVNLGKTTGWGTYGAIFSHVVDLVEKRDKGTPDTSISTIQAYFSYSFGHGWQLISNPVINYDWQGDSDNKLSIPLGGGVAKTLKIGTMPLRMTLEVQKYVVSTDRFGSDLLFQFSVTPVWPNKYTRN